MDSEFIDIQEREDEFLAFLEDFWRNEFRDIAESQGKIAFFDWDGKDSRERIYPDHAMMF